MKVEPQTPIVDLYRHNIGGLSPRMARKLAEATAHYAERSEADEATVEDLLHYFPARYEDRSKLVPIDQLYDGIEASVEIYVRGSGGVRVGKNRGPKQPPLYIFEVTGNDRDRTRKHVAVMWFLSGKNAPPIIEYYSKRFARGVRFVAHGRWEWDSRRQTFVLKVNKPDELEILPSDEGLFQTASEPAGPDDEAAEFGEDTARPGYETIHTARHVPVYRKLGPFQTKRLREIMFDLTEALDDRTFKEHLPAATIKRNSLVPKARALREIHFPPETASLSDFERFRSDAHKRLIFEEFFWLSFALRLRRGERRKEPKGTIIEIPDYFKKRVAELLPFKLTEAQKRTVRTILGDMASDSPMHRLIQGDVGSGKTMVAFIAMLAAAENGYQTALMAPTEILAEQHFRNAKRFFDQAGYRVGLLTGSTRGSEKRSTQKAIRDGEKQIVIGTHAIIQEGVEFEQLGLAVIDEQHRFGVLQRDALKKRGLNPDVLVMTATPIPRSLAMTVYGDLDVSIIDEMPPGRTPVKTVVTGEDRRNGVYKGIERELKLGRQAYVVYPLVEESEKLDLKAATKMYEELRDRVFPHRSVGLLHGRLRPAEKEQVMSAFVAGDIEVLVSTTVIEVGVDVPNASTMVIEHAERFGLSQLHQLRGRVGRGAEQSYCVLMTGDKKTSTAKERLGIMEETSDGFKIAEKDLEIRGEGEILGTRQAGIHLFKIANIVRDIEILEDARKEAELLLKGDRVTAETAQLINQIRSDSKYRLAGIG